MVPHGRPRVVISGVCTAFNLAADMRPALRPNNYEVKKGFERGIRYDLRQFFHLKEYILHVRYALEIYSGGCG